MYASKKVYPVFDRHMVDHIAENDYIIIVIKSLNIRSKTVPACLQRFWDIPNAFIGNIKSMNDCILAQYFA